MRKSTDGMEEEYNTTIETMTELVLVSTFDEEGKEQYVEDLYQEFKITRDFGAAGTAPSKIAFDVLEQSNRLTLT